MAKAVKSFKAGDKVTFRLSHNKAIELTGKVVAAPEGKELHENSVLIEADVDGKVIEVPTVYEAHIDDVNAA